MAKKCIACHAEKPDEEFYLKHKDSAERQSRCKACDNAERRTRIVEGKSAEWERRQKSYVPDSARGTNKVTMRLAPDVHERFASLVEVWRDRDPSCTYSDVIEDLLDKAGMP